MPLRALTAYRSVRSRILDGDLLLFYRPRSAIARHTAGPYSHAAMACWRGGVLLLAESREWVGQRIVTLSSQVQQNPGVIDVYRPRCEELVSLRAADWMIRQAGEPYGYAALVADACFHLPLYGFLRPNRQAAREPKFADRKYCSAAVCWSYRRARDEAPGDGGWDPYPRMPSQFVEPNHLGHSDAFELVYEALSP